MFILFNLLLKFFLTTSNLVESFDNIELDEKIKNMEDNELIVAMSLFEKKYLYSLCIISNSLEIGNEKVYNYFKYSLIHFKPKDKYNSSNIEEFKQKKLFVNFVKSNDNINFEIFSTVDKTISTFRKYLTERKINFLFCVKSDKSLSESLFADFNKNKRVDENNIKNIYSILEKILLEYFSFSSIDTN